MIYKPTFEEAYSEIERITSKRRAAWTYLSIMEWDDVKQEILIRAFQKWDLYDPALPLENWLNTLITRVLHNLRRDTLLRTARPCIGGGKTNGKACIYNLGGDACRLTASGTQCAECPVYAEWQKQRQFQHHIKNQVSLENHVQEVHNKPDESLDVERIREWLHNEMLTKELTQWEGRVFRLTIIKEVPPAKAAEILTREISKRKRAPRADEQYTYSAVLAYNRTFRGMMRQLLLREGYIGEEHMNPHRNRNRALTHD